ncbi:MAG TPA: DUF3047 domain-containing protein [Candidatus Limnocylindria bacterium]|nr:DUF3047 domain-containing protein [Candidatus Limnocylindria bacterium]
MLAAAMVCAATGRLGAVRAAEPPSAYLSEDFEAGIGPLWQERGFPSIERRNRFSLGTDPDGNRYLKVESDDSYSGKGVYLALSPERCPEISWRWRVADVIASADLSRKEGDDAAAKVYVVFAGPSWWNPLDTRLLVYVWDNAVPAGAVLPNAWMPEKARMIVLESGRERAGQWVAERVDVARDFARAFPGTTAGQIQGVAFLADTDNTHTRAEAGIDDVVIRCRGSEEAPPR